MFSISDALILWTQINKEKIMRSNALVHYTIQVRTNSTEWHGKIYNDGNMTSRAPNMQIYYTLGWQQKKAPTICRMKSKFQGFQTVLPSTTSFKLYQVLFTEIYHMRVIEIMCFNYQTFCRLSSQYSTCTTLYKVEYLTVNSIPREIAY